MAELIRIFLAGIMQGSHHDDSMHEQSYRTELANLLRAHLPDAVVYDPLADHQDSVAYDDEKGRSVFLDHNRMCGEVDAVIAFAPEASMGTAIEIWEAFRHGRTVITISPMTHNWAIRFCSDRIYPELTDFVAALECGEVRELIQHDGGSRST